MFHRIALVALALCATLAVAQVGFAARKPHRIDSWTLNGPGGFAFGFNSAWVAGGGTLLRINLGSGRVTARATLPRGGGSPVIVGPSIWLANANGLDQFDPSSMKVVGHVAVPGAGILASGFGSLWTATQDGDVIRVDPNTHNVVARINVQGPVDWAPIVAAGDDAIWVASADTHTVLKIDPSTNKIVARTAVGKSDSLLTITTAYGSVWVHENAADSGRGVLYRLDPTTGALISSLRSSSVLGGQYGGTDIATAANSVWVGNANGTVSRIAADGSRIESSHQLTLATEWLAVAAGFVWSQTDSGDAIRIPIRRFASA